MASGNIVPHDKCNDGVASNKAKKAQYYNFENPFHVSFLVVCKDA